MRSAGQPRDPGFQVDYTAQARYGGIPLELSILGDSTVAGIGTPDERSSMAAQVAERVARAIERPVHIVGYGVSGARAKDVLEKQVPRLAADLLTRRTDQVIVVVGANDATHLTLPRAFRRRTESTLAGIRDAADGAAIVVAGSPTFGASTRVPKIIRPLVDAIALRQARVQAELAAASPNTRFADIARDAVPRVRSDPRGMGPDGFHPSPRGYGYWADTIAAQVIDGVRDVADDAPR